MKLKFIDTDELKLRKQLSLLDDLSEDDYSIYQELELMAIEEISSYLRGRYDTELIFNQVGINRNPIIKRLVIDLIKYYLMERSSNGVSDIDQLRYDNNIKYLMDVNSGKYQLNLPPLSSTETNTYFNWGSEPKFYDSNLN